MALPPGTNQDSRDVEVIMLDRDMQRRVVRACEKEFLSGVHEDGLVLRRLCARRGCAREDAQGVG
jgi:hypothetical protein